MSNWSSPEFLKCVVKHGLLNAATADPMDAYMLEGALLHDEMFRQRRLKLGVSLGFEKILDALSPAELQALRERVTGVLQFRSKK